MVEKRNPFGRLLRITMTSLSGMRLRNVLSSLPHGILEKQRTAQLSTVEKTKWLNAPYSLD